MNRFLGKSARCDGLLRGIVVSLVALGATRAPAQETGTAKEQAPGAQAQPAGNAPAPQPAGTSDQSQPGSPVLKQNPRVNMKGAGVLTQIAAPNTQAQPGHGKLAGLPGKPGQTVPTPTVVLKPGEEPKIEFDMPNYSFGRIKAGGEVVHDFWFTNTGTGPLEILVFRPS